MFHMKIDDLEKEFVEHKQRLFSAVERSDFQLTKQCLEIDVLAAKTKQEILNTVDDESGMGVLHISARKGDVEIVELLLQHGADVTLTGDEGKEAIHFAAKFYNIFQRKKKKDSGFFKGKSNFGCLPLLLDYGANVNARDKYNATPLHYSSQKGYKEIVEFLLKRKATSNVTDNLGFTPLHKAALRGHTDIVNSLIVFNKSSDLLSIKNANGSSALNLACSAGHQKIVETLLLNASIRLPVGGILSYMLEKDIDQNNVLHVAIENEHEDITESLLGWWEKEFKKSSVGHDEHEFTNATKLNAYTALHSAAAAGNERLVKMLLQKGADVDALTDSKDTALHLAVHGNHKKCVHLLLQKKCNCEIKDSNNLTPFLISCNRGFDEIMMILLQHGVNLQVTDHQGYNGLMLAAANNQLHTVQKLLKTSETLSLSFEEDFNGNTPLHISTKQGNAVTFKMFADIGLRLDCRNDFDETPLHLAVSNNCLEVLKEILDRNKASLNEQDDHSRTPLHLAASLGHDDVLSELLKRNANPADYDTNSKTPLVLCVENGWSSCVEKLLHQYPSLLKTETGNKGESLLHMACKIGHSNVVQVLLEKGADVSARTNNGKNPLDVAIDYYHENCAAELIRHETWRKSLSSAITVDGIVTTPLRRMIDAMPNLAEEVLSKCTSDNGYQMEEEKYQVTFDYGYLDDAYQINEWRVSSKDENIQQEKTTNKTFITKVEPISWENEVSTTSFNNKLDLPNQDKNAMNKSFESLDFIEENKSTQTTLDQGKHKKPYGGSSVCSKNHPLNHMARDRRTNLLRHPLVRSFLNHRYRTYVRFFYWFNITAYLFFGAAFMTFMLTTPPRFAVNGTALLIDLSMRNPCVRLVTEARSVWGDGCIDVNVFRRITLFIILTYAGIQLIKEVITAIQEGWTYLINIVNFSQLLLYGFSIFLFIPLDPVTIISGIPSELQWQFGGIMLLLVWMNLVHYLRLTPLGVYVYMIRSISISFLRFSFLLFLLLNAFAGTFYTLFQNQYSFFSYPISLVKVLAMLAGELDFARTLQSHYISSSYQDALSYEFLAYCLFVLFILFMTLLVANLLVGIAVDDISTVQRNASTEQLVVLVETILSVEYTLPEFIRRRWIISHRNYFPNEHKNKHALIQWWKKENGLSTNVLRKVFQSKKDFENQITQQHQLR